MITPVILSGGAGTRLWPLSRPARPKQLLPLTGDRTMLQLTVARASDANAFRPPVFLASGRHADEIERQMEEIGSPIGALVLEPSARSTAPAIALAALIEPSDAVLLVMPSDHVIRDIEAFNAAIEQALPHARDGYLVTFGIRPDRPETGYGYIRPGGALGGGAFAVDRFLEKPDAAAAKAFVASGDHFWNGGIFMFRADSYLAALQDHAPDVLEAATRAFTHRRAEGRRIYPDAEAFAAAPSISIDYAVMEKAPKVAVVPVTMGWSDVGGWDALHEIGAKDEAGNSTSGPIFPLGSSGCLIRSDGPTVVTVGVEDLIVVASGDAVLVLPRGQSHRIKEAIDALRARSPEALG